MKIKDVLFITSYQSVTSHIHLYALVIITSDPGSESIVSGQFQFIHITPVFFNICARHHINSLLSKLHHRFLSTGLAPPKILACCCSFATAFTGSFTVRGKSFSLGCWDASSGSASLDSSLVSPSLLVTVLVVIVVFVVVVVLVVVILWL